MARVNRILSPKAHSALGPSYDPAGELVTKDPAMSSVLELVHTVAATNSRVLITGETGTGKQLIARAIHASSPRRDQPFVDLN